MPERDRASFNVTPSSAIQPPKRGAEPFAYTRAPTEVALAIRVRPSTLSLVHLLVTRLHRPDSRLANVATGTVPPRLESA